MDMPFDKLPKFLAIAGLALASAGATFIYTIYLSRDAEYSKRLEAWSALYETTQRKYADFREHIPEQTKECTIKGASHDGPCGVWIGHVEDYAKVTDQFMRETDQDLDAYIIKAEAINEVFERGKSLFHMQFFIGAIGILAGAGISLYGFKGWRDLERKEKAEKEAVG